MIDEQIDALDAGALLSPCRRWRYLLWRRWDAQKPVCVFVGLNPSTADEHADDPTVRRMKGYATDWGYGALWVLNAYAFRATDPKVMQQQGANAVGPRNNEYITTACRSAQLIVAAWGVHCDELRQKTVVSAIRASGKPLYVLGLNKNGTPKHPLYLSSSLRPFAWTPPGLHRITQDDYPRAIDRAR